MRNNYSFCILHIVYVAVAISCPYDVPACTCSGKTVTCISLMKMPTLRHESDVTAVTEAIFQGGNISIIPDNSLPPGLIVLEFENIQLNDVSDGAFLESANTLNALSFEWSQLKSLPRALLNLKKLTDLKIEYTFVEDWNGASMKQIANTVNVLTLGQVGLTGWPKWLSSFSSLVSLDVGRNSLQSVPEDAFSSSKATLATLNLDDCQLNEVPKALSVLRNLTSLSIGDNTIIDVDGRPGIEQLTVFPCAATLRNLYIDSIGLTTIPHLSNITNLELLIVYYNEISDANTGSFPLGLIHLDLGNNKLTSVPAGIEGLSRLSYLSLSNNMITESRFDKIPPALFGLNMAYNKITAITNETSATTPLSLNLLHLEDNPIKTIASSAFRNLAMLDTLYLYHTELTEIPLALTSLTNLHSLNLPSLPCPCPPPAPLVAWYQSLSYLRLSGNCTTGGQIGDYIKDDRQSTSRCDASTLALSSWCRLGSLLLLLATYIC